MHHFAYNLFLHTIAAPLMGLYYLPRLVAGRKYRRSLAGKFGRLPLDFLSDGLPRPLLWFHAVSVGEVTALTPLVAAVHRCEPAAGVVVSTGTETGQDRARTLLTSAHGFFYLPLDFPAFVNPVVQRIRPDLFVLMETELWPNLLYHVKRCGAVIALANGRISDRSFPRYMRLRWLFQPVLSHLDLLLMSSEVDARRIVDMGAHPARVHVTGSTKFDIIPDTASLRDTERIRSLLQLEGCQNILVAGSIHPGEYEMLLDAYGQLAPNFPDLILILVPRHVERTPAILTAIRTRGLPDPYLWSAATRGEKRNDRRIVVVDTTGELFHVYSLASLVFVGGSLVPKGGQNIVEPAAWGKPVLFGPSMEDFREARDILVRCGAGREVRNPAELVATLHELLSYPDRTASIGAAGRQALLQHTGSAERNAMMLLSALRAARAREHTKSDLSPAISGI